MSNANLKSSRFTSVFPPTSKVMNRGGWLNHSNIVGNMFRWTLLYACPNLWDWYKFITWVLWREVCDMLKLFINLNTKWLRGMIELIPHFLIILNLNAMWLKDYKVWCPIFFVLRVPHSNLLALLSNESSYQLCALSTWKNSTLSNLATFFMIRKNVFCRTLLFVPNVLFIDLITNYESPITINLL